MDARTRPRGSLDTAWTGHLLFAVLSLVAHLIPVAVYFGSLFLGFSWFGNDASELEDHPTIIPIEFGVDELDTVKPADTKVPPPAETATLDEPAPSASAAKKPPAPAGDAGVLDAASDGPDATISDARDDGAEAGLDDAGEAGERSVPSVVDAGSDARLRDVEVAALSSDAAAAALAGDAAPAAGGAATDAAGAADARPYEPIHDPVAVAGDARLVAQRNPNVSLMVYTGRIGKHPLASRHAATLTSIHQWKVFFDGTGLDPVRDTDWMLLAGPQFRNTSRISVVTRYKVPEARMRSAVDALVARSQPPGSWNEKNGVRYAKLRLDGADRFVVFPQARILVIVPSDGLDQAVQLKNARFPSGEGDGTAVLLNLKTPRNAFHGLPADIPATIASMRFALKLTADGGADARIDAEDRDEATALQDAASLTDQLEKAAVIRILFVEQRLFDPVVFRAEGKNIRAETHFSQSQLNTILSMIGAEVDRINTAADAGPARP